jgi:hypothetical protein
MDVVMKIAVFISGIALLVAFELAFYYDEIKEIKSVSPAYKIFLRLNGAALLALVEVLCKWEI